MSKIPLPKTGSPKNEAPKPRETAGPKTHEYPKLYALHSPHLEAPDPSAPRSSLRAGGSLGFRGLRFRVSGLGFI